MPQSWKNCRWSTLLPAIQVLITIAIVVPSDISQWQFHNRVDKRYQERDKWERQSNRAQRAREHRRFAKYITEDMAFAVMLEYAPSNATRVMAYVNLPAYVIVGWYDHHNPYLYPLLWPILGLAADAMPLRTRIVVLDTLFIVMVGLQWWFMGKILDFPKMRAQFEPSLLWICAISVLSFAAWAALAVVVLGMSAAWCWSRLGLVRNGNSI